MSGGLAPSKSTVYVSNLPFSLTNNDVHKVCEKHGKVVKVTIVKDKETHRSKGVAFVLFLERESAYQCIRAMNGVQMFGRTLKCSIARDNGRASEFIRRKEYKDKSKCYECGEEGHLSYQCPKNLFGDRDPPPKKEKKRKRPREPEEDVYSDDSDTPEQGETSQTAEDDSLAAAIKYEQEKVEEEEYRYKVATGNYTAGTTGESTSKKIKYKKDAYFSDEEDVEDA